MARIQILELPEPVGDDQPPFMLIIDQVTEAEAADLRDDLSRQKLAQDAGARTVAVFSTTIDIPDNQVPVDADGRYVEKARLRIEPDFTGWSDKVEEVAAQTSNRLMQAMRERPQ